MRLSKADFESFESVSWHCFVEIFYSLKWGIIYFFYKLHCLVQNGDNFIYVTYSYWRWVWRKLLHNQKHVFVFSEKEKKKCLRSNLSVHVVATDAGNLRESFSLRHCIRQISLELHENWAFSIKCYNFGRFVNTSINLDHFFLLCLSVASLWE